MCVWVYISLPIVQKPKEIKIDVGFPENGVTESSEPPCDAGNQTCYRDKNCS